jgi:Zn-dependent peptidase ImmA (M78 family)
MQFVEILRLAEELAQRYNPEGLSPFPFEAIQKDRNDVDIYITEMDDQDISGAISFDKEQQKFKVVVNKEKSFNRRHFTIAHELGHYFLHQDTIKQEEVLIDGDESLRQNVMLFRLDGAEYSRIETEANNFAASLIMPEALIKKAWETFRNIEECAKIFNVSTTSMSIRLEKLGLVS